MTTQEQSALEYINKMVESVLNGNPEKAGYEFKEAMHSGLQHTIRAALEGKPIYCGIDFSSYDDATGYFCDGIHFRHMPQGITEHNSPRPPMPPCSGTNATLNQQGEPHDDAERGDEIDKDEVIKDLGHLVWQYVDPCNVTPQDNLLLQKHVQAIKEAGG